MGPIGVSARRRLRWLLVVVPVLVAAVVLSVYTTGPTGNTDLYVNGADGRGKFQLTNSRHVDIDPSRVGR